MQRKNDIPGWALPRCSPHLDPCHFDIGVLQLHYTVKDHRGIHLGLSVFQGLQNLDGLRNCGNKKAGVRGIWNLESAQTVSPVLEEPPEGLGRND